MAAAEQRLSEFKVLHRTSGRTPLTFRAADQQIVQWVDRALTPLLSGNGHPVEDEDSAPLQFDYLYDDSLVAQLTERLSEHDECLIDEDISSKGAFRCGYTSDQTAIVIPAEGIAIHLDMAARRFLFVHSSRTRFPAIQFADMVFEPLLRSALNHGGVPFYAGAVATDRGAVLIVGYSGDGKTSLITGLMHAGAAFISNDRTFVKQDGSQFTAHSFPDWVQLGLGTVMNDSSLSGLLPVPHRISVPQGRFSWGRPDRYAPSEWPHLDDRITLLSDELSVMLDAPAPASGIPIVGIVRPKVTRRPIDARLMPIEGDNLAFLLQDNLTSLSQYPDWMGWKPHESEPDIDALMQIPALRFRFYLDDGHIQGMDSVFDELHDALDAERRRRTSTGAALAEPAPI